MQRIKPLTWEETFTLPRRAYLRRFNAQWAKAGAINPNYLDSLDRTLQTQVENSNSMKKDFRDSGIAYALSLLGAAVGANLYLIAGVALLGTAKLALGINEHRRSTELNDEHETQLRYAMSAQPKE